MATAEITAFERLQIQMEYVVPLVRRLQEILGEDVINDALAERNRRDLADAILDGGDQKSIMKDLSVEDLEMLLS